VSTHPQRSTRPPETFSGTFDARVHAVGAARHRFVAWVGSVVADHDAMEELEVVFSELMANAVAASPVGGEVRARGWIEDGTLVFEVSNETGVTDPGPPFPVDLHDPLRSSGRGLMIAEAFVDSVEIGTEPPGRLVVRCHRRITSRDR